MTVSPATIRQRASAAIDALGAEWNENPFGFDGFDLERSELAHRSFAVDVPGTTPLDGDRQRPTGAQVASELAVKFACVLTQEAVVAGTDTTFADELAVLAAVRAMDTTGTSVPRLVSVRRRSETSHTDNNLTTRRVVELRFAVLHLFALS